MTASSINNRASLKFKENVETHLNNVASVTDILHLPAAISAFKHAKDSMHRGDKEGAISYSIQSFQKPASALNLLGSLSVKICQVGSYFKWFQNTSFLAPLSSAISGLGIVLCITEIALETLGFCRTLGFQSKFLDSPLPTIRDWSQKSEREKIRLWAKRTENRAIRLLKKTQDAEYNEIIKSSQEVQKELNKRPLSIGDIQTSVSTLNQKILQKDLDTFASHIIVEDTGDKKSIKIEELHRRLGIAFVDKAINELSTIKISEDGTPKKDLGLSLVGENIILNSVESSDEEKESPIDEKESLSLKEVTDSNANFTVQNILGSMHIQLQKRKLIHTLGIAGATILLAGLVLSFSAVCPIIPAVLIIVGVLIGLARFLVWAGYSESEGWNYELDKWVQGTLLDIKEKLLEPISSSVKTFLDALPERFPGPFPVEFTAGQS